MERAEVGEAEADAGTPGRVVRPGRVDQFLFAAPAEGENILEVVVGNVVEPAAEQETVAERGQHRVVRDVVGRPEQCDQVGVDGPGAVVKGPLVDEGEQRVEDRRAALEHLVEECDVGFGQHSGRVHLVDTLGLEPPDVDRPEQLGRFGEPG